MFTNTVCAKTDFSKMLPPELPLTTKPTESQSGDLGEIHRNTSCVIRQKNLARHTLHNSDWKYRNVAIYANIWKVPLFDVNGRIHGTNVPQVTHSAIRDKWFPSKFLVKLWNCSIQHFSHISNIAPADADKYSGYQQKVEFAKILWNRSNHPQVSIYPSN